MKLTTEILVDAHPGSFRRTGQRYRHPDFKTIRLEPAQMEFVTRLAVGTFTDMVNCNQPFQEALVAVFLTGLHLAQEGTPSQEVSDANG